MTTLERISRSSAVRWSCPDCPWTATDYDSRRLRLSEEVSRHVTKHIVADDPADADWVAMSNIDAGLGSKLLPEDAARSAATKPSDQPRVADRPGVIPPSDRTSAE